MKVYICGPKAYVHNPKKNSNEEKMISLNRSRVLINLFDKIKYIPINPINKEPIYASWKVRMKRRIRLLMRCDAIFLLEGWQMNLDAHIELIIAKQLEYKIMLESDFNAK